MDRALNELEADPRVTFYLLPLPSHETKRQPKDDSDVTILPPNKFVKGGKGKKGKGKDGVGSAPKRFSTKEFAGGVEGQSYIDKNWQEDLLELQLATGLFEWSQRWAVMRSWVAFMCRTKMREATQHAEPP